MMWFSAIIGLGLIFVVCGDVAPIYSPSYANVYYQGTSKQNSLDTREEVTELPELTDDEVNPTIDTNTEPFSESVNFTKYHKSQGPKKIHEAIELSEELDPTSQPDLEPTDLPILKEQGTYYIYHPSGLFQRIIFSTKNDFTNMEYVANFNYQNVEPVVEPIYTYDPNTLFFQRLQFN